MLKAMLGAAGMTGKPASQKKAFLMTETGTRIPLLFNPSELKFSKTNSWEPLSSAGNAAPTMQFQSGGPVTTSLSILFDTTDTGTDVSKLTDQLFALTLTDDGVSGSKEDRNNLRPPTVQFHWGSMKSYKMVVTSLSITFTYFASDGTPLRAKCDLELSQFQDEGKLPPQNPTSGTPTIHKMRPLRAGEYLDTVAQEMYGSSGNWRAIAEANGITDPLDLRPGRLLVIPQLEE